MTERSSPWCSRTCPNLLSLCSAAPTPERCILVHINDMGPHVAALRVGSHQSFVLLGRHIVVLVGLAAVEDDFQSTGLALIAHGVDHTGFDSRQLHGVLLWL